MARYAPPKTEEQAKAAREGLDKVLAQFTSKNDMARGLGVTRNTVSWWFTKGFVGGSSVTRVAQALGMEPEEVRPDILLLPAEA